MSVPSHVCQVPPRGATTKHFISHVGWRTHPDEDFGAWCIVRFGRDIDPNIRFHEMTDEQALAFLDNGRTDTVVVGILSGPLDEHQDDGRPKGKCSAELVAEHVGIAHRPAIQKTLDLIRAGDTSRVENLLNLGFLLKWLNRSREEPVPLETVLAMTFILFDGLFAYFNGGTIREVSFEFDTVEVPSHICFLPPAGAAINHVIARADAVTDLGEQAGIWLLEKLGGQVWKINRPKRHFMTEAEAVEFLGNGRADTIVLGMLGGPFDGRTKDRSSASLLASYLRVGKRKAVKDLLKKVRKSPETQENDRLDLGFLLKWVNNSYRTAPVQPEVITTMVSCLLDGLHGYFDEERVCDEFLAEHGIWFEVGGFRVCLIESDLDSIGRSMRTHGAAITVIRRKNGQTMISTNHKVKGAKEVMPHIVMQVCNAEIRLAGGSATDAHQALVALCQTQFELGLDLPGLADCWYWHAEASALYNGTITHPDVRASLLSLQRLGELVKLTLEKVTKR